MGRNQTGWSRAYEFLRSFEKKFSLMKAAFLDPFTEVKSPKIRDW